MTEMLMAAKFIGAGATIADSYKIGISNKFPLLICTRYKSVTSLNANLNLLSGNLIGVARCGAGSKLQLNCNLLRIYGSHKSVIGTVFGNLIIGYVRNYSTRRTDVSSERGEIKVKITYVKDCRDNTSCENKRASIRVWDAYGWLWGLGGIWTGETREGLCGAKKNSIILHIEGRGNTGDISIYNSKNKKKNNIEAMVLIFCIEEGIEAKRARVEVWEGSRCEKYEFKWKKNKSLRAVLRDKGYSKED